MKPTSRDSSSTQTVHFQDFSLHPYTISFILQGITNVWSEKHIYDFYTNFATRHPIHRVNLLSFLQTKSNIKKETFCHLIKMVFLSCFCLIIINMDNKVYIWLTLDHKSHTECWKHCLNSTKASPLLFYSSWFYMS